MAKEYIDREAVIKKLNRIAKELLADNSIQCSLAAGTIVDIKDNVIAKQRAADVAEVRHGEWEYGKWEQGHWVKGNERCKCSVCRRDFAVDNLNIWYGCPHCLAKMDGKKGDFRD